MGGMKKNSVQWEIRSILVVITKLQTVIFYNPEQSWTWITVIDLTGPTRN